MTVASHANANSQVTVCPECKTGFRVTDTQLQAASGRVRCGSCMRVFQADRYWANTQTEGGAVAKNDATAAIAPMNAMGQAPSETELEFSDSFLELTDHTRNDNPFDHNEHEDADSDPGDEQWAKALLEEDENQPSTRVGNSELSAILSGLGTDARATAPSEEYSAKDLSPARSEDSGTPSEIESAERWMQQILAPEQDVEASATGSTDQQDAPEWLSSAATAEPDEEYIPEVFRAQSAALETSPQIEPAVVNRRPRRQTAQQLKLACWWIAVAASLLLLAFQYAWFSVDKLAYNPNHRDQILAFCKLAGCSVPSVNDISRINSSNLVVFRHPRVQGALVLDTILTNHTEFEQPYPRLVVEFTDGLDRPVAARAFAPAEYLGGELTNSVLMPAQQPIHLSLELADPGETAVNYRVRLLPHQPPQADEHTSTPAS